MLALLLVTKNEADLLRWNLRHHLAWGVDRIAVADNGSTDDTRAVVAAAGDRVIYRSFSDFHTRQTVRHEMLRDLFDSTGGAIEWATIADTDEFFWSPGDARALAAGVSKDVDAINFGAKLFLPTALDAADGPVFVRRTFRSADESSPIHTSYREGKTMYRAEWLLSLAADHNCPMHEHQCIDLSPERTQHHDGVVHHYMIQDEDQFVAKVTRLIEWVKPPTAPLQALRWRRTPVRRRSLPTWSSKFKKEWWRSYREGGEEGVRAYYRDNYVISEERVEKYLECGWIARDDAFARHARENLV